MMESEIESINSQTVTIAGFDFPIDKFAHSFLPFVVPFINKVPISMSHITSFYNVNHISTKC